jgi:pimeloyl-ACP methyl ester carboxylesterase
MGQPSHQLNNSNADEAATNGAGKAASNNPPAPTKSRKRRGARIGTGVARIVLVLLFILGFFLSVFPGGQAALRTVLLAPAIIAASEPAPLALMGEPIRHVQKTIPSSSGPVYLDIYEPTSPVPPIPGAREGLVLIPGVGDNRQVPQLINLVQSLARIGIVVEDVTTDTLIANNIAASDSDAVVQAFNYLSRWSGVGANRVGIAGFSGGGALACLAAADPRIRDRVRFVAMFGSYFNAETVLQVYGRRAITVNGKTAPWQPAQYPLEVLANIVASGLSLSDGQLISGAFAPGGQPLTPAQLESMSPAAVAAYHLLEGDEPNRVNQNIAAFSPQLHALLNTLSPSSVIGKIRAPIYILHSRDDTSVPITEADEFAAALKRIHHPYDFVEFGIFQHVQVESNPPLVQVSDDVPPLFRVLSEILQPAS